MPLPLVIEIEAELAASAAALGAREDFNRIVAAPTADALAPPVKSAAVPPPAAAANPESVRAHVLRVVLGKREQFLHCTQEEVTGFVGLSYLAGGFPMVIAARRAIERGVADLAANDKTARDGLAALETMATDVDRKLLATKSAAALPELRRSASRINDVLKLAQASLPSYSDMFRKAWNAIAAYEEELLKVYEGALLKSFKALAAQNKTLAASEWEKYAPRSSENRQKIEFSTAKIEDVGALALSKTLVDKLNEPDKATSPKDDASVTDEQRAQAINRLWQIALDLHQRADDIRVNRQVASDLADKSPAAQRAFREQSNADHLIAWNAYRKTVAADFPVLMQVYPGIASIDDANNKRKRFGLDMAQALLRVRDECDAIERRATVVWDSTEAMRVVPVDDKRSPGGFIVQRQDLERTIGKRTAVQRTGGEVDRSIPLRSVLDAEQLAIAEKFGLTILASEVLAALLNSDQNRRRNSGWMHAPVGFDLLRQAGSNTVLARYFEAGTIAHAAVSRVLDSLATQREREQKWEHRGMMLMWGAAALLAPFTEGAALYGAALVQAGAAAHEIFQSVEEYQNASSLSAVSLAAIEEAAWRRPSTVNLVRLIVADLADVVQNTIGARGLPIVLDIALGALSVLHPD